MTFVVGSDPEGQEMMQGDWVRLAAPFQLPACPDEPVSDVVIISQTCDVVQKTRTCILVAPIVQTSENNYREASRGKRPLLLAFPAQDDAPVVLLEHATLFPRPCWLTHSWCEECPVSQLLAPLGTLHEGLVLPIHGSPCLTKQFLLSVSSRTGSARRPRGTDPSGGY